MQRVVKSSLTKFTKQQRLLKHADFQAVFNERHKVAHGIFLAFFKSNQVDSAKLGIIVPKRIVKTAVKRNTIKRLIRESFRHHVSLLKGLDIIILVRAECSSLTKPMLRQQIDQLWLLLKKP